MKYKAWHKKWNKWVHDELDIFINPEGDVIEYYHHGYEIANRDISKDVDIVFFTGLKDKNGKEIYEGDVMDYRTYAFGDIGKKGVVCFDVNQSKYKIIPCVMYKENENNSGWSGHAFDLNICEASKVIGNIHENPELLKESEGK